MRPEQRCSVKRRAWRPSASCGWKPTWRVNIVAIQFSVDTKREDDGTEEPKETVKIHDSRLFLAPTKEALRANRES